MPQRARRVLSSAEAATWVAGPLAYCALVVLLAKLARGVEITVRTGSYRAWPVLPMCLGEDLMLVALVGLCAHAAARARRPWGALALTALVLAPIGGLLAADVLSHKLTGAPITWSRLRGDEGANLGDLDLLAARDLWGGLAGIALSLALIWPVWRFSPRLRWIVAWARKRALLVTLIAGACLALAQGAFVPSDHGLAEQPVFVLAGSFADTPAFEGLALGDLDWARLHQPGIAVPDEPVPTRHGEAKNVVMFLAEGIPTKHTGFAQNPADPDPTPNLTRRWRRNGLLFDRYRANWHASIQAIFSIVCSAFPPMRGDIVRIKPRIDCGELSEVMRAHGVTSGLFHGGRFNFYNKLALLGQRAYAIELDAEELARKSTRRTNQWGIDDRAVVDATLSWIDGLPSGAPFAALLIPITAHYPYWVPRDHKKVYPGKTKEDRFLEAVRYQDEVVEQLMRGLEKRGLYEDTLVVWLGDHGHAVNEIPRRTPGVRGFYEPNLHTPLLFINPRMFPRSMPLSERVSHRTGSHPDLLPTIMDAMGLPPDPRWQGQSLLSASYHTRRVFFSAVNGKYVGFVEGQHKFAVETRKRRTEYYDLDSDPEELDDISDRYPKRMSAYTDDAIRFARAVRARIDAAPVLQESVSVENLSELFLEHVTVRHQSGETWTDCPRDAKGRPSCPDLGAPLALRAGHFQGEKRQCVVVQLPPPGDQLELSTTYAPALQLMTGTIVALTRRAKGSTGVRVSVTTDGRKHPSEWLSAQKAARPRHPRALKDIRFLFTRNEKSEVDEVCLQLTTFVK